MKIPFLIHLIASVTLASWLYNSAGEEVDPVAPSKTNSWWFPSIFTRIYEWWYGPGDPSECRDLVVWEPDQTSAEEWLASSNSWSYGSSSGSNSGSGSSSSGSDGILAALSKSSLDLFLESTNELRRRRRNSVYKSSLTITEASPEDLEAEAKRQEEASLNQAEAEPREKIE